MYGLDKIYGNLYDFFNQGYIKSEKGIQCRIGFERNQKITEVNENIRCVIIEDKEKSGKTERAFLNRFEKVLLHFPEDFEEIKAGKESSLEAKLFEWYFHCKQGENMDLGGNLAMNLLYSMGRSTPHFMLSLIYSQYSLLDKYYTKVNRGKADINEECLKNCKRELINCSSVKYLLDLRKKLANVPNMSEEEIKKNVKEYEDLFLKKPSCLGDIL